MTTPENASHFLEAPENVGSFLLDLGLPGGDGFVVLERLQQLAPLAGIPVIVISARDPSASRERALAAGAVAFLPKPIDMDELFGAVRDALGE